MDSDLYNKSVKCPVCGNTFEATKVKMKASRVSSRDTDFCVYYEGINPIFYDVWVCEFCGYAMQQDKFLDINLKDIKIIKENVQPRWNKRSYAGERNIDTAIESFKLALYSLQLRKAKNSDMAKVCLRLAWLYRMKKDEKESDFLNFALRCYSEAYEKEPFPVEKLDEFTCMYMIGELNRRVGNNEAAIQWFSRLIGSPEARRKPTLIDSARDQFQLVKEQMNQG